MFNSIRGTVTGKGGGASDGGNGVFILTGGLEWEIAMPSIDIDLLPARGEECRVFTWLYHRDDQMRLFGFSDEGRRNTFLELLKVEGIGPKGALKIMGGIGQEDLERALEAGDLARLEAVPGLGKKTAQKMLLALKGKLISVSAASPVESQYGDLVEALTGMGYEKRAAADALVRAEAAIPTDVTPAEKEKLLFKNAIVFLSGSN